MAIGGWSSTRMLKRYVYLGPNNLHAAVEGLVENSDTPIDKLLTTAGTDTKTDTKKTVKAVSC